MIHLNIATQSKPHSRIHINRMIQSRIQSSIKTPQPTNTTISSRVPSQRRILLNMMIPSSKRIQLSLKIQLSKQGWTIQQSLTIKSRISYRSMAIQKSDLRIRLSKKSNMIHLIRINQVNILLRIISIKTGTSA